jgi:hypothetical protein
MVFWNATICRFANERQHFEGNCKFCLGTEEWPFYHEVEAAHSSKTLISIYETIWHHIPEDHNPDTSKTKLSV